MLKKSLLLCILVCSLAVTAACMTSASAEAASSAEIAMDFETGCVYTEHNSTAKLPMASTTKIMTAILIIEDCDLDAEITVADSAVGVEGSSIYLKKGELISVRDLLYGLMLRSGNDAATALAIHHSGSVKAFVEAMNDKAREIGATCTHFSNPSGLPDDEHYTTAKDLCEITRYALHNKTFKEVVSTKSYSGNYRSFANKNKFLYNYEGALGVKTGYTLKAGRCLVTAAERNGRTTICVVLNCPEMYERCAQLSDDSFNNRYIVKIDENNVFMSDRVLCKVDKTINFPAKTSDNIEFKVEPIFGLTEIKAGDMVGKLKIYCKNNLILCENLYSIMDSK